MTAPAWKPIASAPKDGSAFLGFYPGWAEMTRCWWYCDPDAKSPKPYWRSDYGLYRGVPWMRSSAPSHWMALPDPPARGEA